MRSLSGRTDASADVVCKLNRQRIVAIADALLLVAALGDAEGAANVLGSVHSIGYLLQLGPAPAAPARAGGAGGSRPPVVVPWARPRR